MNQTFPLKARSVFLADPWEGAGTKYYILPGIQSVDVTYELPVAETMGLKTAFLQPWYLRPVHITLKGKTYIGAFRNQKPIPETAVPSDVALQDFTVTYSSATIPKLIQLIERISTRILNGESVETTLIVGEGTEQVTLRGYFTKFSYTESISHPFIFEYDMTFIGTASQGDAINAGAKAPATVLAAAEADAVPVAAQHTVVVNQVNKVPVGTPPPVPEAAIKKETNKSGTATYTPAGIKRTAAPPPLG